MSYHPANSLDSPTPPNHPDPYVSQRLIRNEFLSLEFVQEHRGGQGDVGGGGARPQREMDSLMLYSAGVV